MQKINTTDKRSTREWSVNYKSLSMCLNFIFVSWVFNFKISWLLHVLEVLNFIILSKNRFKILPGGRLSSGLDSSVNTIGLVSKFNWKKSRNAFFSTSIFMHILKGTFYLASWIWNDQFGMKPIFKLYGYTFYEKGKNMLQTPLFMTNRFWK